MVRLLLSLILTGLASWPTSSAHADEFSTARLQEVGFDQRLDQQLPADIPFVDDRGESVQLGDYFQGKPVILTLNYFNCSTLCPLILESMGAFDKGDERIGQDFTLLTVSIDPRDSPATAAPLKAREVMRSGHPEIADGWHFLSGDRASIARLTEAVGFRYAYDEGQDQFAHPAGILVLSPTGKIARYLYGIDFSPLDLRLALTEASNGTVGTPFDQIALLCYHYDPATGRYSSMAMTGVRAGGVATILALGWFLVTMWRQERRSSRPPCGGGLGRRVNLASDNVEGSNEARPPSRTLPRKGGGTDSPPLPRLPLQGGGADLPASRALSRKGGGAEAGDQS